MYWIVKNWEIQEFIRQLPKSTKKISWLNKLSDDKLRELWYYKVVWNSEPLKEWQSYWQATYDIWEEVITETKEIINQSLDSFKEKKIKEQIKIMEEKEDEEEKEPLIEKLTDAMSPYW